MIRRTYTHLDETALKKLYFVIVRPHLEFYNSVWAPSLLKDI
jgi:hypothetical protein